MRVLRIFFGLLLGLNGFSLSLAMSTMHWESVGLEQVSVNLGVVVRNRRNPDATVDITLSNLSGQALSGPLRLVITNLSPSDKVSIANATGQTENGEAYFDLTGYVGNDFVAGGQGLVKVLVKGGGPTIFSFHTRIERQVAQHQALSIQIIEPATLQTVGHTPQTIRGTVNDPTASITLNGAPVINLNGRFQAEVTLQEGHNTVIARAVNGLGEDVSDAIGLSLDMTPPYLTISSPKNGDVLRTATIAVSGLINDIVRGTVAEGQAHVKVNGVGAAVSNRSYLAENIVLTEGENQITIDASDAVGNTSQLAVKVHYQPLKPQHIEIVAGQDQTAKINSILPQALSIKLLDEQHHPVANKPVIFRVTEGDGKLGMNAGDGQGMLVMSDNQGIASTSFMLGSRAGVGNQRVRATSVGFDGEVLFFASATVGSSHKLTVNSGNNQRGAIGQPLAQPFVVAVVDEGANLIAGASVEFKVTQGGGRFQNGQTQITRVTDSDGRATAELTLGEEEGLDVHRVSAHLLDAEHFVGFTASALKAGPPGQTSISGVVMDNQDQPLSQVTLRVDGTNREAKADAQGQFKITEVPVGPVRLIADGSTAAEGGEYPTLAFDVFTVPGADNPLSAPIYLVKLDTEHAQTVGDRDVTLTLPDVPGFALEVKAGSVTFPDGNKTGRLSVTPVNASKIPMAPPNGMQPKFIVTIQPVGARFDPPARLSLPNVDGHKPGAQVEMYSYDHDLEEFVAIGLGTVSSDGSIIKSNEGVGVIKAGWHCGSQPGGSGCAASPGECQRCEGNCQIGNDDSRKPISISDIKGDCKRPACKTGLPTQLADITDLPDPTLEGDNACKTCDGNGEVINDIKKNGLLCKLSFSEAGLCNEGKCSSLSVEITTSTSTLMNISQSPKMPSPLFNAKIDPSVIDLNKVLFKWYLELNFNQHGRNDIHRVPASGTVDVFGGSEWSPGWNDFFSGGVAHVYVEAIYYGESIVSAKDDKSGYEIKGDNPVRSDVNERLIGFPATNIACWESGHGLNQFGIDKWPLFGPPNGWGIMQIDNTPDQCALNERVIWNWKDNVDQGLCVISGKKSESLNSSNNVAKIYVNSPSFPSSIDINKNTYDARTIDVIKRYNGGKYFSYDVALNSWVVVNSGPNPSYVSNVLSAVDCR